VTTTDPDDTHSRARIRVRRLPSFDAAGVAAGETTTIRGFPWYISDNLVLAIEPEVVPGGGSAHVLLHLQELAGGSATVLRTLRLGNGYQGIRWARERGYLLFASERCDTPATTLSAVHFSQRDVRHEADLKLPGMEWQLVRATDEVVVLVHGDQYAIVDVSDGRMTLRGYETHGSGTVVDISGGDVRFIES
jgi:hypothetical protein